jgi:bifunctional non-homologous end joining protein LigD
MPDTPFSRVIEVARWLHDELERLGTPCVAKTSGSSGVHIYIPLPPGTPYEAGMIFCQILATIVASRHPKAATVERMVKKRPTDVVYIDYLQNIYGKTLATAYSARASTFAGVSTPLTWDEVHDGLKTGLAPQDFTMETIFTRLDGVGDLWAELRTGPPADLHAILQYAESLGG